MPFDEQYPDLMSPEMGPDPMLGPPPGAEMDPFAGEMDPMDEGVGMGEEAFFSEDPETMQAARESITVGSPGGICFECSHFDGQGICMGYGAPLMVQPDAIQDSAAFRPALEGGGPPEMDMGMGADPFAEGGDPMGF